MRVIVHGGAGGIPEEPDTRQKVLDDAANAGAATSDPLDAVESALKVLESNDRFNAGYGGAIQSDGVVRTDAGIMRSDREAGAATSMAGIEHAISVARVVLEETPHVLIAGDHAVDLASDFGIETGVELRTEKTTARFTEENPPQGSPREHLQWLETRFGTGADQAGGSTATPHDKHAPDHDTVGAVAYDGTMFVAATSTGGRSFALAGRVGDVPQIGSGFYASPAGGASSTGAGEDIAKTTLTRRAVRHLERGMDAQTAADLAIEEFGELTGSSAGVIVLDDSGAGSAFNSDGMQTSVAQK
ncbi:isoaspartyl peptidase/L-asparaginase [Natronocalculus amylovorans]|uniref:Plant-type L-asparaginase n=1 Tax=Natronocalculus amylovorans TaxID=2917812 RepID=A0AAE3FW80_9EURY|nr:isoaspartyl peptidase/L-asparaginase [Natronocalculus amylovorans]MCL9816707.1 isoaspartyl peptidase/L-asparaginase [Natronocalculus amylovorans]